MLESEIAEIAHDIWATMFGVELAPATTTALGPSLTGIVHIQGAWQGAVTLECPATLASDLAARLFGEVTDAGIRDLLGELANELGGNIKAMLPGPCTLSLPAVATGDDFELRVIDTEIAAVVTLAFEGTPFVITLLERA